jgi:hypothetical protein
LHDALVLESSKIFFYVSWLARELSRRLQQSERRPDDFVMSGAMPLYFFDLYNDMTVCDPSGHELPDLEAAKKRCLKETREMIAASVTEQGKIDLRHCIKVRDEDGADVHCIDFEDAVSVQRGGKPV